MRTVFIATFLANILLALLSLAILPNRVAIHFGLGGAADSWTSSLTNTLIMLGMHVMVFASLYFAPTLLAKTPSQWISLPNRDYWLAHRIPEKR